ncbi:unnamed protein product [Protopolystoma xenopodis]|uniref:Uncharacterized protein n=1 Tax=Protopolystoma xenopodis TaxID=117903 RepID=A0A448XAK9_9PLAT|nr:unnamed protein product [Protopolystoma xenopodis]
MSLTADELDPLREEGNTDSVAKTYLDSVTFYWYHVNRPFEANRLVFCNRASRCLAVGLATFVDSRHSAARRS